VLGLGGSADVDLGMVVLGEFAGPLNGLALGVENTRGATGVLADDRPIILALDDVDGGPFWLVALCLTLLPLALVVGALVFPLETTLLILQFPLVLPGDHISLRSHALGGLLGYLEHAALDLLGRAQPGVEHPAIRFASGLEEP
jgi:hypothetical protein